MADDLNTEIKIGADASGVEAGVSRAKRSLKDLGDSAKRAGQDAGAGIGAIGSGGDKAAKDVERATKNIQGQLQRAIASFDAGEKGSRKFYESLARQRGADVNTLQPLLDQLDAYKSKSEAAAQASAKVGTSFTGLSTAAGLAARAMAAIGITASVGEFVRMADASTNVASRLGLVTSSAAELANVQQRLFGIAQSSRVSFTDLVGTYAQVARSTKDLGVSQTALLGVIQTISQAVTISGGSAASAQAALVQLSQGFAAGALRGEELNSIMEQTPRLAQAIADGMGVSVGKLRELGQAGALTAEAVLGALEKSAAGVAAEFGKMAVTVEQASTNAANSVLRLVGAFDRLLGVTSAIGGAIQTISNGLDFLSSDVEKLGNQGPLRDAAREVINLNAAAERLRTGMASGVLGPNAQGELDRINARLAEAKKRFRELDQQLSGVRDPRDQSGFTGRGTSYANEAARQAKLREDANAFRLNQAGVPASYLKDMAELIRLNQAGVIVGKEYTDALKKQQDELLKKTGAVKSSNAAANQEQNAYESLIASIRAKIEADNLEIAGGAALTESQRIRIKLDQDLAAGRVKLTAQNERAVRLALEELAASEASALAAKTLAKANLDAAASREKYLASLSTGLDKIKADTAAQLEATARMGLSKEAIAELDAAKLEMLATDLELQAIKAMDRNLDEQTYNALKQQAEAYRELAAAKKAGATKEMALDLEKANREAAKKAADEWQRAADDINRSLTDALMRGFESGKDFAKNMRDTVVNMFNTMVLRPVISAVMSPISGAINGALYGNAAGVAGAGNSLLGGIQTASNLNTLWGAGSQAIYGATAGASLASLGYANTVGALGGDALGALISANGGWAGVATGAQATAQSAIATNLAMEAGAGVALEAGTISTAAGGATASGGFMSSMAAAGPYIAAALAVAAIASSLDDSGTYHTGGAAQYSGARGLRTSLGFRDNEEGLPSYNPNDNIDNQFGTGFGYVERGDQTITAVSTLAQSLGTALDGIAVAFGQKAGYEIATAFADDTSEDGAWGALRISKDGQELLNWQDTRTSRWAPKEFGDGEAGYKEYLAAVAKDTRQVLLDMDLPSWADKMLTSIGDSASMEQLTGVLTQIGVVQSAFVSLGKSMEMFAGLTDEMQSGLLGAAGSIEALTAGAGAFYQGFYSEQERVDAAVAQLNETMAGLDLSIDPTLGDDAKDQFRAAVEAAFAAGDAELAAALLAISGNFASAADYFAQLSQQAADAAAQAAERQRSIGADLQRQIYELTGDAAAIRQLEIAGMDAANVALYDRIQALQAEAQQTTIRADLERQILELTGDTAAIRQLEIAGMDAANVALYDRVQALQAEQTAVQATVEASQKAVEAERGLISARAQAAQQAYSDAQAATGAALASTDRSVGAQREVFDASRSAAMEAAQEVKSLIDTLSSGIKGLYGEVESARTASAAEGLAFIDNALRNARATGYLPDSSALNDAISSASSGIGAKQYTSQADQDFDRLVLAGQLKELNGYAEPQLTAAEQAARSAEDQIKALDDILRNARDQVDELRGIDTSVKSIPEALAALQAALVAESQAQTQAFLAGTVASLSSGQIKPQDAIKQLEGNGAVVPREQWTDLAGTQAWVSTGGATALGGTPTSALDAMISSKTGSQFTVRTATDYVNDAVRKGDLRSIYDAAVLHGISSTSLDAMMGWPGGTALDWAKSQGLPAFAVGTNYVPQDMAAIVHKGEMIVPAAYNPAANPGMSGNTARLEALIEKLNAEVAELKGLQRDSNRHQRRTAEAVNGNPDAPMLVETV